MRLVYDSERKLFIFICLYHERHIPRESGFRWDPVAKSWYTASRVVAQQLQDYADNTETQQALRGQVSMCVPTHVRAELARLYVASKEEPECSVCMVGIENMTADDITSCGHILCTGCAAHVGRNCPVCRTDFRVSCVGNV